ncbi:undecaprenyldiphospho-muramoylpentapeptide beta-N-acetylglucosaminyltransferase [Microlunatus panaciterrae]|uniref:UDP-N-acetylglucosamine--N-acetylmuramyl-(pentapeptide) pyrophosphoryl-undecaprenol N-acetylglucosamine transferase n=1 Tax=Microlunatus panaciterrae TaxID=400768 RepID=A0ABS2RPW6_9ACTN|nr:undecaprenyldiphospho-muramoylpentapeptide beta-N-acetylglucosaminyltransferase [Microlunatus panaciterrae]MBM7800206.1 UDP-N-acetylglucosamine--N-acetylmuramyl-(pentapeptide) pyrophosphoryl-undecaprenol N-acetylglucosamine transferase [Microlunatus panaciterrae]
MTRPLSVVLAGGGSAGHTSPLIATAQALTELSDGISLTAVGTSRGLETRVMPEAGLPLELIAPVPMPRRPNLDLLKVPVRLWGAVRESEAILRRHQADVVLGFGGYVSTPVYLAARRLKVPIVIHEQNALPGLANKLAARFAERVAVSFPDTPLPHARYLGLPLRRAITQLDREQARPPARALFGLSAELPTLLVSGGSQGAQRINQAVAEAKAGLLSRGIQILHVLGPKNMTEDIHELVDSETGAAYRPLAFVDRMEQAYAAADLMLGRSGANTVAETAVVGLPAIFVPWPYGNGEQARNAAAVVGAGGGELLRDADCTGDYLAERIPALIQHPDVLARMAAAARSVAVPDAASQLAKMTLEVAR